MTCQSSCCKLVCWSYQEIESDAVLILCTYAHHFRYKLPDYGTTITQHGLAACTKNPDLGDNTALTPDTKMGRGWEGKKINLEREFSYGC